MAAAAAAAGVLLVQGRGERAEDRFESLVAAYSSEAAGGAWASPTAALMEVTGMGLTRTMPAVGDPLRDFDPGRVVEPGRPNPEGPDGRDS